MYLIIYAYLYTVDASTTRLGVGVKTLTQLKVICLSVATENWFQNPPQIRKSMNTQVTNSAYPRICIFGFSSIQFSCSVVSNSLWSHELQHARPPCPSPTPGVLPNPCPLSRWCHPTISSSVVPFSFCPQSFQASVSFQISQLFTSGGQSFGVSAATSVFPMNTQDWSPLGWTG